MKTKCHDYPVKHHYVIYDVIQIIFKIFLKLHIKKNKKAFKLGLSKLT